MHGADPGHAEGSIERQRDSVAALLCYYTFPEFMLFPTKPRSGLRIRAKFQDISFLFAAFVSLPA
ncbi:MAG: hypothetical protein B6D34_07535 [Candidatus Brocadia sp. UTAMX1]|nr:MAG: hypothetical protein B6D34_07535 [Candidatus Brocadia sp. UTAMX1]